MVDSKLNPKNETIKKAYLRYLTAEKEGKVQKSTAKTKLQHIDVYDELFEYADFIDYDNEKGARFYKYITEEKEDLAPSTQISYLTDLLEFFTWYLKTTKSNKSQKDALSAFEPSDGLKALAQRTEFVKFPTDEEIDRIMNLDCDLRDKAIMAFQLLTGARVAALSSATLKCVDMENKLFIQDPLIGIKTKKKKYIVTRFMEFKPEYLEILQEWIKFLTDELGYIEDDLLFPKMKDSGGIKRYLKRELEQSGISKVYEKLCKAANVEVYHPHAFRHYAIFKALQYVRTGVQLRALSQNVGHEEIDTILNQYAKMLPEKYANVLAIMFEEQTNKDLSKYTTLELIDEIQKREKTRNSF